MPLVPSEIFKAYDIRGIVDRTLTSPICQLIGRAIGTRARELGQTRVAIGRDGRLSGPELSRALALPGGQLAEALGIPGRTLHRRKADARLTPDESDRLVRLSRLYAAALDLFEGDAAGARQWLASPALALGGATPLRWSQTEPGAREVEALIGRLEHGVFS